MLKVNLNNAYFQTVLKGFKQTKKDKPVEIQWRILSPSHVNTWATLVSTSYRPQFFPPEIMPCMLTKECENKSKLFSRTLKIVKPSPARSFLKSFFTVYH